MTDVQMIREHGWAAAHEAAIRDTAIIPEGYELRTLVRELDAVWHDRNEAEADAEIRAAFQTMHGAPPLLVEIVEEPCVDGRRVLEGRIRVLVVALATRPAKAWHPAVPEPEPETTATAPTAPKRRPREKRAPKPKPKPVEQIAEQATVKPRQAPTWTPGTLDHKTHRQPSPGLSIDLHYPTTASTDPDRRTITRAVGALAAAADATDDDLREIIHMLADHIPNAERIRSLT